MTKEFLKEILSENKFKAEFIKYENKIFTYKSKLKFYENEDSTIMKNKYTTFEIPIDSIKDKILTPIIDDVLDFYEFAVL